MSLFLHVLRMALYFMSYYWFISTFTYTYVSIYNLYLYLYPHAIFFYPLFLPSFLPLFLPSIHPSIYPSIHPSIHSLSFLKRENALRGYCFINKNDGLFWSPYTSLPLIWVLAAPSWLSLIWPCSICHRQASSNVGMCGSTLICYLLFWHDMENQTQFETTSTIHKSLPVFTLVWDIFSTDN